MVEILETDEQWGLLHGDDPVSDLCAVLGLRKKVEQIIRVLGEACDIGVLVGKLIAKQTLAKPYFDAAKPPYFCAALPVAKKKGVPTRAINAREKGTKIQWVQNGRQKSKKVSSTEWHDPCGSMP